MKDKMMKDSSNVEPNVEPIVASKNNTQTNRVRQLNDAFRKSFVGGQVVITSSVNHLCDNDRLVLFEMVKTFDAFTPDNDPHEEHDFGSFKHHRETYFWKIDCYDLQMLGHSPDPTDPAVTRRVLTIMKAEEY